MLTVALPELATAFMMVFARVGTLVMLLPGLGERLVPGRLRLGLALLLTLILYPLVRTLLPGAREPGAVVASLIGELAVGLVLGVSARMVMGALQIAGSIIAQELGLSFAMTVDPTQGAGQEAAIGNFLTLLGVTLIFATDLHHLALMAIRDSYAVFPPVGVPDTGDAANLATKAIVRAFGIAVELSAPFIAFAFLFNLGLGVLSRLMPQLQVFFLAMPLTIFVGTLILLAVLGVMMGLFIQDLGRFMGELGTG